MSVTPMPKKVVYTSTDNGDSWNMSHPDNRCILVIKPGAGVFKNYKAYRKLQGGPNQEGYTLLFLSASGDLVHQDGYDIYPEDWADNSKLSRTSEPNLANLAFKYKDAVGDKIPGLIICGSRGGQVTLGLIWRNFWRGPTIVVNAGCLTSNTPIPMGVFPVMVTMGGDYFETNNPEFTHEKFKELSEVPGMLLHIHSDGHMPSLLSGYINNLVGLAINRNTQIEEWENRFPSVMGLASALTRVPLKPGRKAFAIMQNANHYSHTVLRSSATSARVWQQNSGVVVFVKDGDVVSVARTTHADENTQLHMYLVEGGSPTSNGWIFSWNVVPMGHKVRSLILSARYM
jgi:hypothetical protein